MSGLSRREFFRRFGHTVADKIDLIAEKEALAKLPAKGVPVQSSDWVVVGRMAEFVPGIVREVSVGESAVTIRSQADGMWAERHDGQRIALRSEFGGVILANLSVAWPKNGMLSHLTGELKDS